MHVTMVKKKLRTAPTAGSAPRPRSISSHAGSGTGSTRSCGRTRTIPRAPAWCSARVSASSARPSSWCATSRARRSTPACCSWCASASVRGSHRSSRHATWTRTTSGGSRAGASLHVAGVQAALLHRLLLPPPPARALVLAGVGRPSARLAADRHEAAVVQRVVRHLVLADVGPHLLRRPVGERVELHERALGRAEGRIELDDGHLGARPRTLVLALAGDPGAERPERAHQRLDLAHTAALLVSIAIEGIEALL